jgi:hypothetical protein
MHWLEIQRFRNGRVERRFYYLGNLRIFRLYPEDAEWERIKSTYPGETLNLNWGI